MREVGFFQVHVFPYSPRSGTTGFSSGDLVPFQVKSERRRILEEIEIENLKGYQSSLVGKNLDVLVETASEEMPGWGIGTSCRGVRVELPGMIEALRKKIVPVTPEGIRGTTLWGTPNSGLAQLEDFAGATPGRLSLI